jgi:hypothetical protein
VAVRAQDRQRLEQLCRYAARPPLAVDRLSRLPDGRLTYRLKTPWQDGTTHVVMEASELLERLAALVPAPRVHIIHYFGILAPAAKWRPLVVPAPVEDAPSQTELVPCPHAEEAESARQRRPNLTWAQLMQRVFAIDVLQCPRCLGPMRVLAAIHAPEATRKILECLGLPCRAPPVAPARRNSILLED